MNKNYKLLITISALFIFALTLSACTTEETPNVNDNTNLPPINSANNNNNQSVPKADYGELQVEDAPINQDSTQTNSNNMDNQIQESQEQITSTKVLPPDQQSDLIAQYSRAIMKTNLGDIEFEFYKSDSPVTVNNFMNLAQAGFYNGTIFHRVIDGFMVQGGDPNSKNVDWSTHGFGGPGYAFKDEINSHKLVAGSLAMANSGPGTNGSQFFIVTAPATPWLDGAHTNFGTVISGMEIVRQIEAAAVNANDHPLEDIVIENITLLK